MFSIEKSLLKCKGNKKTLSTINKNNLLFFFVCSIFYQLQASKNISVIASGFFYGLLFN